MPDFFKKYKWLNGVAGILVASSPVIYDELVKSDWAKTHAQYLVIVAYVMGLFTKWYKSTHNEEASLSNPPGDTSGVN